MANKIKARIVIADDKEEVRLGIRTILSQYPEWEFCGEASNGKEAVDKCIELTPDICILDVVMPEMNGFEAAAAIHRYAPNVKVIFVSLYDLPNIKRTFEKRPPKGDGYVLKYDVQKQLPTEIRRLLKERDALPQTRTPS